MNANVARRTTLTVRTAPCSPSVPSAAACAAAVALGFVLDDLPARPALSFDCATGPGGLTLITGPSGSGKSRALHALRDRAATAGIRVVTPSPRLPPNRACIDLLGHDVGESMRRLAYVGLADHRVFVRRPRELSDGERARLSLALALRRAESACTPPRPALLMLDEPTARLDEPTSRSVLNTLARAVRRAGRFACVIACHDAAFAAEIKPEKHVALSLDGLAIDACAQGCRRERSLLGRIEIAIGEEADYRRLAHWHYRPGLPAMACRTRVARDRRTGERVGALVVTMPAINSAWRRWAWGDDYRTGDRARDVRRLNREVRRIARVVVDPRYRGIGLARRLVECELADPLTPRTEAIAAMGAFSPFFERAGMTAYPAPIGERSSRLLDVIAHAGVESWRLAQPRAAWARAIEALPRGFLDGELERWRRSSNAPKGLRRSTDPLEAFAAACRSIASEPMGYAHTAA